MFEWKRFLVGLMIVIGLIISFRGLEVYAMVEDGGRHQHHHLEGYIENYLKEKGQFGRYGYDWQEGKIERFLREYEKELEEFRQRLYEDIEKGKEYSWDRFEKPHIHMKESYVLGHGGLVKGPMDYFLVGSLILVLILLVLILSKLIFANENKEVELSQKDLASEIDELEKEINNLSERMENIREKRE